MGGKHPPLRFVMDGWDEACRSLEVEDEATT